MNFNMLLKLCAVFSSLLLVAVFVSYRAGALGWLTESNAVGSPDDETGGEFSLTPYPQQIFFSSKDGPVFIDSMSPEEIETERQRIAEMQRAWWKARGISEEDLIHSSKFGPVFIGSETPVNSDSPEQQAESQ